MYHLKKFANNPVVKQEVTASLAKLLPIATLQPSRNYAEHQIPERLKDVADAKGEQK